MEDDARRDKPCAVQLATAAAAEPAEGLVAEADEFVPADGFADPWMVVVDLEEFPAGALEEAADDMERRCDRVLSCSRSGAKSDSAAGSADMLFTCCVEDVSGDAA